jgi:methionyl-tRNA formyltransferase
MGLPGAENIAAPSDAAPGQIYIHDHRMFAACAGGTWIELIEVQLEGKKRMSAGDFLRGMPHGVAARLG